jgi:hypothetical protein
MRILRRVSSNACDWILLRLKIILFLIIGTIDNYRYFYRHPHEARRQITRLLTDPGYRKVGWPHYLNLVILVHPFRLYLWYTGRA